MNQIPASLIDSGLLNNLPTPPAIAVEILRLADDPEAGLDELAKVLEADPALSARLVAMSNSATYARSNEVASVRDAATVLGARTLSLVALSFSLASSFEQSGTVGGLNLEAFWRRSLTIGFVGRYLARFEARDIADEAFLAGLLSLVGRLVIAQQMPAEYRNLVTKANSWPSHEEESSAFGFSSLDVTLAALDSWGLPHQIADAVRQSFDPDSWSHAGGPLSVGTIVGLAVLADAAINASETAEHHIHFERRHTEFFGDGASAFDGVPEAMRQSGSALRVRVAGEVDGNDLLASARAKLLEASIAMVDASRAQADELDDLQRERAHLEDQAMRDSLTGLTNRRALDIDIAAEIGRRSRERAYAPLGVVLLDIDHFKKVNDTYGHGFGDEVLTAVGTSLASVVRRNETVYRYGGEEFLLFMPTVELDALAPIGERFRKVVEAMEFSCGGSSVSVTVSVGVAASADIADEDSVYKVIESADKMLYQAKHAGRNCVVVHAR